jgi:3-methylcrotonyl-CoA carboxylase alpha subunit
VPRREEERAVKYFAAVNGKTFEVQVVERLGRLEVAVDGRPFDLEFHEVDELGQTVVLHAGQSYALSIDGGAAEATVTLAGHRYDVALEDERERAAHAAERAAGRGGGVVTAIMPGVVVEVLAQKGQRVEKGAPLLILSAMKMQNEIGAIADGVVLDVHVAPGQAVSAGARLITLAPPEGGPAAGAGAL